MSSLFLICADSTAGSAPGVPSAHGRQGALDASRRGIAREHGTVDRPDRGAEDQVGPDFAVGQGAEHSHLVGSEDSAAAEDERGLGACTVGFHVQE